MATWYVKIPPNATPYSFYADEDDTEANVRALAREWLGVKRLPNGTQVWPDNSKERAALEAERQRDRLLYREW